jgi:N-acetylneuraminate synthase
MKKTLIIAEAGVNHNGDLNLAKKLIDKAAEAGADYIKFQTFISEELVTKTAKKVAYQKAYSKEGEDDSQYQMLKSLELTHERHYDLIKHCKSKNIKFLSTAFDLKSLEFLSNLNLDFYKVPSGEITNHPFLREIGKLNTPVIFSTGMANLQEIEAAIEVLMESGTTKKDITVLHCNTQYPTPMEDVNLLAMKTIEKEFGIRVGYSDHTMGIEVAISAVALGAHCIEKHFTLDKTMDGPDHKASLEPEELKTMIQSIRNIERALGNGVKEPSYSEKENMAAIRKSIHLLNDCKKGHIIKESDLVMKRPGDGISPMLMQKIIGLKLSKDLNKDHKLSFENFA